MTTPITRRIEIAAPVGSVWRCLDDDSKIPLWMPEVVGIRYPNGKPPGSPVGTRFVQSIKEGGRTKDYDGQVMAHEPEHLLGIQLGDPTFQVAVVYRLEDRSPQGCVLRYECRLTVHTWLARLLMPIARPLMNRILDRHLARLKRLAETGSAE